MPSPGPCSVLVLAAALSAVQTPERPPGPTAAQIVERYIAARGGLARIRAVRTLVLRAPGRFMARARPYYWLVVEPGPTREYAEGNDGAPWEYVKDPGLVLRTTGAPAAAARHTSYFDDPLVGSLEPGWRVELAGTEDIGGRPAYRLRATFPDGFQTDEFVDTQTFLRVANRKVAPVHAFGAGIATETRISDYRDVNGALFPMTFREFVIATGKPLDDVSGTWTSAEANALLPPGYFSPPPPGETPLARMLNAAFAARAIPTDALGWYRDFRTDPATAAIDTEAGIETIGYQCLKNEAVPAGVMLLEENLRDHPSSAAAHFGPVARTARRDEKPTPSRTSARRWSWTRGSGGRKRHWRERACRAWRRRASRGGTRAHGSDGHNMVFIPRQARAERAVRKEPDT